MSRDWEVVVVYHAGSSTVDQVLHPAQEDNNPKVNHYIELKAIFGHKTPPIHALEVYIKQNIFSKLFCLSKEMKTFLIFSFVLLLVLGSALAQQKKKAKSAPQTAPPAEANQKPVIITAYCCANCHNCCANCCNNCINFISF